MHVLDMLKERGFIAQVTFEEDLYKALEREPMTFYLGIDPTADSLHVGHFMALCLMKRLQMAGNKPIALIGDGTTLIGDPSGRTDMRQMLTEDAIKHNAECFKRQMEKFIDFSDGKALMLYNSEWLKPLNYIEMLREVGACFSVNNMLRAECYKQRMEKGLSFLEFNYMIMQSYDFYYMFQHYGCNMQFGGNDQWSNMLGGTELIRKKLGKDAHAMTITLLLNSEGKKMGKTASGAVWLDPNKTSPFEFFQYWRNVDDADVLKCIRMLTFLPLEEIDKMSIWEGSQLNEAKEILAYELTKLVHGQEEAEKAKAASKALFAGSGDTEHMPTTELTNDDFGGGSIDVLTLLVKCGLAASKGEARRLVQQGGVSVNDEIIHDIALQRLGVVLCLDRAGLVGEDGATHQGAFDMASLRCIPDTVIAAPKDEIELKRLLYTGTGIKDGPFVIRYPRGLGEGTDWRNATPEPLEIGKGEKITDGEEVAVLALGPVVNRAVEAAERLRKETGKGPAIFNVRFLKPFDPGIMEEAARFKNILTLEDGCLKGGLFSEVSEYVASRGLDITVKGLGIPDRFITQAPVTRQRELCGLDTERIYSEIAGLFQK